MAGNREERITETSVGSNSSILCRKKKKTPLIECIPDKLLFKILLRLSAPEIYFSASFVCSRWWHMIHTQKFIYSHLKNTSYGLLYHSSPNHFRFVYMNDNGDICVYRFCVKFRVPPSVSCNGLLLEFLTLNDEFYSISNLSTLRAKYLPPFPHRIRSKYLCGMGYDAASHEYKVVVTYGPLNGEQCAILTIGVDESWRNLRIDYLSPAAKAVLIMNSPLITEGFMHWEGNGFQVVTLDVGTETMYETPPPIPRAFRGQNRYFMTTGRYLSLLIARGKLLWEVREMRPETGEWLKLPDICLEAQKRAIGRLGFEHDDNIVPCGWLKYPEVLGFRIGGVGGCFIIFYELLTKEFRSIKLSTVSQFHKPLVHKNSLVWLGESLDLYSRHGCAVRELLPSMRRSRSLSPVHYPDPL